jgi:hypothetical protein
MELEHAFHQGKYFAGIAKKLKGSAAWMTAWLVLVLHCCCYLYLWMLSSQRRRIANTVNYGFDWTGCKICKWILCFIIVS